MEPARWRRIEELFEHCSALAGSERDAALAEACGGDRELRAEVERLLASAERDDEFLEPPVDSAAPGAPGETVGAWRLERALGSGGMGSVHLAHRAGGDFEQKVALKLLKRGMDTDHLLRRFRDERRVLAGFTHPGIARLIDGGAAPDGRPYLVMEFVDGVPIDAWCDARGLGIDERLRLFVKVCDAVQHAHDHLVVHRDIKPSNVLVTPEGEPKLLDFGIAKVLDPAGGSGTLDLTATEQRLMTPEYAAPEQVRGGRVSPATDVYALGVVLFELLTGRRPYRLATRLRSDVERIVCEEEPPRPSRAAEGGRRRAESRRLRGDLDTIVLEALRKEPERRYADARELSEDVRRALDGLPVRARPDTWAYRARKFAGRHRLLVAATLAVVAALSVGLVLAESSRRALERERDAVFHLSAFQELEDLRARAARLWPAHPRLVADYEQWLAEASELVGDLDLHRELLGELRARAVPADEVAADAEPAFENARDRWWHARLVELVAGLEAFADPDTGLVDGISAKHGWGVRRRLAWAARADELTLRGPRARERWAAAVASIADPDDCPAYDGLRIEPQTGLLPLGRDPRSGLWEFADLQTGEEPVRDADGELEITAESALVLVLLPGGTFSMGAQAEDPGALNYDPGAAPYEGPPRPVELRPFFVSKYEVMQSQWERLTGENPSLYVGGRGVLRHHDFPPVLPVDSVTWRDAGRVARRLGMSLPSEAQWEHAARAGTTTPWWRGPDPRAMEGAMNVADRAAADAGLPVQVVMFDDGVAFPAPVDAFEPNPFGLHNMSGNVAEWSLDAFSEDFYRTGPRVEPVHRPEHVELVVCRGGSFAKGLRMSTASARSIGSPDSRSEEVGLRPVRALDP